MSPDKRQALPKHWFPIDFSLVQPYFPSSLFHCFLSPVISSVLSLHLDPKLTGNVGHLTQKEFVKHRAKILPMSILMHAQLISLSTGKTAILSATEMFVLKGWIVFLIFHHYPPIGPHTNSGEDLSECIKHRPSWMQWAPRNRCYDNLEGDSSIHHPLKSWWWKQGLEGVGFVEGKGSGCSTWVTYNPLTRILLGYNYINTSDIWVP